MPYLVNGNSGKAPSTDPADGGFSGWSLFGADRISAAEQAKARWFPHLGGPDWVSAQIRPHVDDLTLTAPATMRPGSTAPASAVITQGTRPVPVAYPVSADWSTSHNLRYDAITGTLKALHRGTGTVSVTVNGVTRTAEVRVS